MGLWNSIQEDIKAVYQHDPAARNTWEIVLLYPGFHARLLHRLAHTLWNWHWPFFPRCVSHFNRAVTGIEIHPGAKIGERFVCEVCGNEVTVTKAGGNPMMHCCGDPMRREHGLVEAEPFKAVREPKASKKRGAK